MSSEKDHSSNSRRGFASMDESRQREIASQGGKAAHEKGTAHKFTSDEARAAGSKGGHAAHEKGTAHEFSSEEARQAGKKGGQSVGSRSEGQSASSSMRGGISEPYAKAGSQNHGNK
jgi:uncharacterized protein